MSVQARRLDSLRHNFACGIVELAVIAVPFAAPVLVIGGGKFLNWQ